MVNVILTGWNPGLRKIDLTKLLQERADLSLGAAKACVDRLLGGEHVTVPVSTLAAAEQLVHDASSLGAIAEVDYVVLEA